MNSVNRWLAVLAGIVVVIIVCAVETQAQSHEGFLYGKVTMRNNDTYTGPIRWANEEVLWTDMFNAAKTEDQFRNLVPKDNNDDSWFDGDWSFSGIWANKAVIHKFTCQFGNIAIVEPLANERARLTLKNGAQLTINGSGYNDIGTVVQVIDPELGTVKLNWDKIQKIEFQATPVKLDATFGLPVYGTIEGTRRERYTGYIVWDDEERLTTDKLDGDSEDGRVSLRFGDIQSIERSGNGSEVITRSGRKLYLRGTNDVNDENRGVLVAVADVGVVKFNWDAFRKVTFSDPGTIQRYDDFKKPKAMVARVSQLDDDRDIEGRMIYDVDEALDFEVLEGKENDIDYIIPMKNIRSITPKNSDFSEIILRNGDRLLLGDSQDVSSRNNGVLIFQKGKKDPQHVSWRKINEITIN